MINQKKQNIKNVAFFLNKRVFYNESLENVEQSIILSRKCRKITDAENVENERIKNIGKC